MDFQILSHEFRLHEMAAEDWEDMAELALSNPQYYAWCNSPFDTREYLSDLENFPENSSSKQKHFLGFYEEDKLAAVIDFVEQYPQSRQATITFFMVDGARQCQGLGTQLLSEILQGLGQEGIASVELEYQAENPQADRFWKQNGFCAISQREQSGMMAVRKVL